MVAAVKDATYGGRTNVLRVAQMPQMASKATTGTGVNGLQGRCHQSEDQSGVR
jgi:hypothetical protein